MGPERVKWGREGLEYSDRKIRASTVSFLCIKMAYDLASHCDIHMAKKILEIGVFRYAIEFVYYTCFGDLMCRVIYVEI